MYGNVLVTGIKEYLAGNRPVWLSVDERKSGGGSASVGLLPIGSIVKSATPVYLDSMGGQLKGIEEFEVLSAVSSTDTTVILRVGSFGTAPISGMILGKSDDYGVISKSSAIGAVVDANGVYNVTITANALGILSIGDKLIVADSAGANKSSAVIPNGLTWHDAYISEGSHTWTAAVVTKGQIIENAISPIPTWVKDALKGITFEKEE